MDAPTPTPTPESRRAARTFLAALAAVALWLVGYDVARVLAYGTAGTISHGMWVLGAEHSWVPWAWCGVGTALVWGLAAHFWWT